MNTYTVAFDYFFFKYSTFQILYHTEISKSPTYSRELKLKYKLPQKEKNYIHILNKKITESKTDCHA